MEVISGQTFDRFLRQRIFVPPGMKDASFRPSEGQMVRFATIYRRSGAGMTKANDDGWLNNVALTFFSGGGGLMSSAEDYALFGRMLLNGGHPGGARLLSLRTVELMSSVFVPDTIPGLRKGTGFGLGVRIVSDPVVAGLRVGAGSYGWDGYYGTYFWVDPREKVVAVLMVHTENPNPPLERDFEYVVMQAIID